MGKTILIGGAAGGGVAKTAVLISKIFTNQGYYIFNYRDYPSLIKGGHNFNVMKISDKPIYSHETTYDMIFALDQDAVDRHEKDLKEGGFVLGDKSLKCKNLVGVDLSEILNKIKADKKFGNDILIGALCKIFDLSLDTTLEAAKEMFGKYFDVVEKTIREGYDLVEQKFELQKVKPDKKYFISGSEAIASGAIASGIDLYVAYPITPATPVLHLLASKQVEHGFLVIQPENEIAVISSALGASYSGAMTMVGTSGAGFALMAESVSMQGMSEIPMVIYMSQRTGPATGVPTYNSQGDLKFVLNAGHGEFPKIVVAPGDAKECFYRTVEAFYLANKYRVISIILGDKHVAESNFTFDDFEEPKVKPYRCITKPTEDYKSYLLTENGVSPRSVPGQNSIVRATSYEHDEYGYTTENEERTAKMNDKRMRKIKFIEEEISKLEPISIYGKGENLVIGWGSTKGAILDAVSELENFKFMQVSYISPFPKEAVKKEIEKAKNIILVENNATGLLGEVIAEHTGIIINKKILKYDSRVFTGLELIDKLKVMAK